MDSIAWIALLVILLLCLGAFVLWIRMLINAAHNRNWAWFVLMLVFGLSTGIVGFALAILYRLMDYTPVPEQRARLRH